MFIVEWQELELNTRIALIKNRLNKHFYERRATIIRDARIRAFKMEGEEVENRQNKL